MRLRGLTRRQAFAGHLIISLVVGLCLFVVFRFLWYPDALWNLSSAGKLIGLVIGVDVTLGPLLTLIVFNPKKRLLPLDLACIVTVQVAALAYGLYIMAQSRPVFLVAAVDRFNVVAANDIDPGDLAQASRPEYRNLSWSGPALVGAHTDLHGDEQLNFILSTIRGGADIEVLPRFYTPFEQSQADLLSRARSVDAKEFKGMSGYVEFKRQFDSSGLDPTTTRIVMLSGRVGFGVMAIDAKTARPLKSFAIDLY